MPVTRSKASAASSGASGNTEKEPLLESVSKSSIASSSTTVSWTDDGWNIALLVFLYLLQGVPLGLSFGSIPFLLKSKLSYADMALFSLSSYPYSSKLLWSPFVDSYYFPSFGRRKSWIVPIQAIIGTFLLVLGSRIDTILDQKELPVVTLAIIFTLLVFLCATQDIAVDGWALTLLKEENKTYASTAQTVGLNTGYFLSFTVFLAFNSPEFCNSYLRSAPLEKGLISLGSYLQFWGVLFLICDAFLVLFKKEDPEKVEEEDVTSLYKTIYQVCMMPHMQSLIVVLLIGKLGFIANDAVTGLKLLERGFHKEHLALAVLLDFPLQLFFGYYAAKWSGGARPLKPWLYAFWGRLGSAVLAMVIVVIFPAKGVTNWYFGVVIAATVLSSFMSTVQFVGMGSFFAKISDPAIGGTYMTLLNTLSNLGGTWPRYFVLKAVDYFTDAPCSTTTTNGIAIKCSDEKAKNLCLENGGTCAMNSDGYYVVNFVGVVLGLTMLLVYILPTIKRLERIPPEEWKLKKKTK